MVPCGINVKLAALTYTSHKDWNGHDDVVIKVSDALHEATHTIVVNTSPVNDAPEILCLAKTFTASPSI